MPEPIGENPVFRYATQNAIRSYDGCIDRSRKNQHPDDDHENMKRQTQTERTLQVHGKAADQILEEKMANVVWNDHHGKEGNERGEKQAVDADHERSFFEIRKL